MDTFPPLCSSKKQKDALAYGERLGLYITFKGGRRACVWDIYSKVTGKWVMTYTYNTFTAKVAGSNTLQTYTSWQVALRDAEQLMLRFSEKTTSIE